MQLAGVAFCGHGDKVSLFFSKRPETVDQNRERERETSTNIA